MKKLRFEDKCPKLMSNVGDSPGRCCESCSEICYAQKIYDSNHVICGYEGKSVVDELSSKLSDIIINEFKNKTI